MKKRKKTIKTQNKITIYFIFFRLLYRVHYICNLYLMRKWYKYKNYYYNKEKIKNNFSLFKKISYSNQIIKNKTSSYWKPINYHIDDIDNIWILDIQKYKWYIISRFFYWIFDLDTFKWWLRLDGSSCDDFLIKVWFNQKWFYDINIGNFKGIFCNDNNLIKWKKTMFKNKFKNYKYWIYELELLFKILRKHWASSSLIKTILDTTKTSYSWSSDSKNIFFKQKNILDNLKIDKDKEDMRNYYNENVNKKYKDKYWYFPEKRYRKKYKLMIKYFWLYNKVSLYIDIEKDLNFLFLDWINEEIKYLNEKYKIILENKKNKWLKK